MFLVDRITYDGPEAWTLVGLETEKIGKYFHLQASFGGFISIYIKEFFFCVFFSRFFSSSSSSVNTRPSGHSPVCLLFKNEEQKKVCS